MKVTKRYAIDATLLDIRYFHAIVEESTLDQIAKLGLSLDVALNLAILLDEVVRDTRGRDELEPVDFDLTPNAFAALAHIAGQRTKEQDAGWGVNPQPLLEFASDERLPGFTLEDMIQSFASGQGPMAEALKTMRSRGNARNN